MKIKDIISSLGGIKSKVHVAHRINRCSPQIKHAVIQLYKEKSLPLVVIGIQAPDSDEYVELSSHDLVRLYGMEDLAALLFLDELDKANSKVDKTSLRNLLGVLSAGRHQTRMVVTDELLEHVQKNTPEVWEKYQEIVEKEESATQELKDNYDQVMETEI